MSGEILPPRYAAVLRQLKGFALGVHPLSKYGAPLLLLLDALLCSLIITKVACKLLRSLGL